MISLTGSPLKKGYLRGMLRIIGQILLLYIAYKVIFDIILPLFRTNAKASPKADQPSSFQDSGTASGVHIQDPYRPRSTPQNTGQGGDYIEFEEIK